VASDSGTADSAGVTFRLTDRQRRLAAVRLVQELGVADPLPFDRVAGEWQLRLDRPEVDRLEYLLEVTDHNGHRSTITDPGNPRRAPGAFGEKSVVEFAGYRAPRWLDAPEPGHVVTEHSFPVLDQAMPVLVWSPVGLAATEPAPLVAVHDGPEYAALGGITRFLGAAVAAGTVPPLRAALLDPGDRNAWYAANPEYARALCEDVLPDLVPTTVRVGVGVSLGALAMLHAHRSHPNTFDGLLLQSGSFFTPELDAQESDFDGFAAVTSFVQSVHRADADEHPVPAVLTCGVIEENRANNELLSRTLQRLGYRVELFPRRDAHNFVAWRDALDPHLSDVITAAVGAHAT
jgi:enterochelin esterase-like enzyme